LKGRLRIAEEVELQLKNARGLSKEKRAFLKKVCTVLSLHHLTREDLALAVKSPLADTWFTVCRHPLKVLLFSRVDFQDIIKQIFFASFVYIEGSLFFPPFFLSLLSAVWLRYMRGFSIDQKCEDGKKDGELRGKICTLPLTPSLRKISIITPKELFLF
jgi:hypothetical protein